MLYRTALAQRVAHRVGVALVSFGMAVAVLLIVGKSADALIVPTIPLGTSADFSVLAGSAVTNTGASVFEGSVGVWPGTAITNVTPTMVLSPGTIEAGTPVAQQAQADLSSAYGNAATRLVDFTTATAQLGGLNLVGGVYAAPGKVALGLTGILTLDGQGDSNSVFIFQTDFALNTAASSQVVLINGALECNVFWQVGSSATLGASSTFVGTILAQTAITVGSAVSFHGRALARDAAVTVDTDVFTQPECVPPVTSTTLPPSSTTTLPPDTTTLPPVTTTLPPSATTTASVTSTSQAAATLITTTSTTTQASAVDPATSSTAPILDLPHTGSSNESLAVSAFIALVLGLGALWIGRDRTVSRRTRG